MHKLARKSCRARSGLHFTAGGVKYTLMGKIGDGAVGIVRKAENKITGKLVAIKFLAPDPKYIDVDAFDDVSQRFQREGMRGLGLDHENLVKIIAYEDNQSGDCFETKSVKNPFIVMEYIRGSSLESLIKKLGTPSLNKPKITKQTLSVAVNIAKALNYLHEHKIIHRDLKPANIFLSSITVGQVPTSIKLGDFGVTKWGDFRAAVATGALTVSHQQGLGTLKYMSPEQAVKPRDVTVRSDIFSLGITLFELFTGRILPSPHHIFEIMSARNGHGAITGKLYSLGIEQCSPEEQDVFSLVLDMFFNRPNSRPSSKKVLGNLEFRLSRLSEH